MSEGSFRFLHASELELGAPLFGVTGLTPDLRQLMIDARVRALQTLADAAIEERADLLVLSGGVIAERGAGPRALVAFGDSCERLASHGIAVYWMEDAAAAAGWLNYFPLPSNVYIGDSQTRQSFTHACAHRSGLSVDVCAGVPTTRDDSPARPRIAVLPAGQGALPLACDGVDYWALGGRTTCGEVPAPCGRAWFAGATQGRGPDDEGARGCLLVEIAAGRQADVRFLATDSVRWLTEHVAVAEQAGWQSLRKALELRRQSLADNSGAAATIVRWVLDGHGACFEQLWRDDVSDQLLAGLRLAARNEAHPVWSLLIDFVPDAQQSAAWSRGEPAFAELSDIIRRSAAAKPSPDLHEERDRVVPAPHFDRRAAQKALRDAIRRPMLSRKS